jgi:hypothetical protein
MHNSYYEMNSRAKNNILKEGGEWNGFYMESLQMQINCFSINPNPVSAL